MNLPRPNLACDGGVLDEVLEMSVMQETMGGTNDLPRL